MQASQQLKELFSWNSLQAVLYLFGSLAFLFVGSFSSILDALVATEREKTQIRSISGIVSNNVNQFVGNLEGQDGSATIATLVFWSAAGAMLYIFFWALVNAVNEFFSNSALVSSFVHSQAFNNSNHWSEYISRTIFRMFSIVLLVAYSITFVQLLMPLWSQLFEAAVGNLSSLDGTGSLFLSIGGCFLSVHIYSIIFRLIVMRTRVFVK